MRVPYLLQITDLSLCILFAILIMTYIFTSKREIGRIRRSWSIRIRHLISLLTIFSAYFNNYVNYLVDVRFSPIIVVVMMFWFIITLLLIAPVINAIAL